MSDRAATANRRLLLRAIQGFATGRATRGLARNEEVARSLTGPLTVDTIAPSLSWEQRWRRQREAERRAAAPRARREANASREARAT